MIKKITILSVIGIIIFYFIYVDKYAFSNKDGSSPGGYSSSQGDSYKDCTDDCHGGTPINVTGWITTNIPTAGYTGGTQYTISATATSTQKKGFELTAEKTGTTTKIGTFASGTGTKLCNNSKAVCTSNWATTSPKTWTFTWIAPAAGTGSVTFYASFALSYSSTRNCSLVVAEACTAPTLSISPTSPTICSGNSTTLTASGTSASYSWSSGGTTAAITVSPTTNTTYTVTGTLSGCTSTSSVTVSVTQTPTTPTITQISNYLQSSATTGNQWYNSSGAISGATSQTYTPQTTDTYYVIVTSNNCPSAHSNSITVNTTGIADNTNNKNYFELYPNPAYDFLTVINPGIQNAKYSIYNVQGKLLYFQPAVNKNTTINISNLEKGVYFIKAESTEGTTIKRFIKE
ncbi:MAG TPA: T9SS type A sorting domain-containing protein [Bacteroidales bacterium]|nr:T9SS type A sorting domain-containing protein [Bacteroidales bacterium]HPS17589.1 T9SS type A sorting domain-containing protein [Bacteroidales bacterium]